MTNEKQYDNPVSRKLEAYANALEYIVTLEYQGAIEYHGYSLDIALAMNVYGSHILIVHDHECRHIDCHDKSIREMMTMIAMCIELCTGEFQDYKDDYTALAALLKIDIDD